MEQSVGLIILTEIPGMGLVAVLRERGMFNFEMMSPEKWPGGCQATVHGKIEPKEQPMAALMRGTKEELGEDFAEIIWGRFHQGLVQVYHFRTQERDVITFAVRLPDCNPLKRIRLSPDTGAIRFLKPEDLEYVVNLTYCSEERGSSNREVIAMFPDEKEAVAAAFERLNK